MHILAIPGSLRARSTNRALLEVLSAQAPAGMTISLWSGLGTLPAYCPDRDDDPPAPVLDFAARVAAADGLVFSVPEYARSLPGAFKNALDWLVPRDELVGKPIALAHASHRGEDMLAGLRHVLATVSSGFAPDLFLRFPLTKMGPVEAAERLSAPPARAGIARFLEGFRAHVWAVSAG